MVILIKIEDLVKNPNLGEKSKFSSNIQFGGQK